MSDCGNKDSAKATLRTFVPDAGNVRDFILNNGPDYERADALKPRFDQALLERGFADVRLEFNVFEDCWELEMTLGQNRPPFGMTQSNGVLRAVGGEFGFQVPSGRIVSIVVDGRIKSAFNLVPANSGHAG